MKNWHWLLVGIGGSLFILAIVMVIPVIILDLSWWIFWGALFFIVAAWMVVGVTLIILKLKKVKPIQEKVGLKEAEKIVINKQKYDEENPDNFVVEYSHHLKVGKEGSEKTSIGVFYGHGTELKQHRVVIVNLANPKKEITPLIDPTKELVSESTRLMADNPPDPDVWEEAITKQDPFGRPMTITRIRRPSGTQDKIKKEEQKAEEVNAM